MPMVIFSDLQYPCTRELSGFSFVCLVDITVTVQRTGEDQEFEWTFLNLQYSTKV
jgi:hypothetical protein